MRRVFLVPGFFGFANLGDFPYFSGTPRLLAERLAARGKPAQVEPLSTLPTASIHRRAHFLAEAIAERSAGTDEVHLVGHSTGGLDARFLVSSPAPGLQALARRVRSVITVAAPHRGTPVAARFTGLMGQRLLRLLSLSTLHAVRLGGIPLPALIFLGNALRGDAGDRVSESVRTQIYRLVLSDFGKGRRREIEAYFDQAQRDQTLLLQLTPESMDLFHALASPRPGVRFGCVVTKAPPPGLGRQLSVGLRPARQAGYGLYRGLHRSARLPEGAANEPLTPAQQGALEDAYGTLPTRQDSDGMVPTLSQPWGDVVHATVADHLDVMGHFRGGTGAPDHVDWLRTGSNFGTRQYGRFIDAMAAFVAGERATSRRARRGS
ncbi:MAG: hypothetical protein AAGH15_22705 [Myxococcota bacterium]